VDVYVHNCPATVVLVDLALSDRLLHHPERVDADTHDLGVHTRTPVARSAFVSPLK
jgi:hypothetical protein